MTIDDLRGLLAYNRWATGTLLDACDSLTPEQLSQPVGGSFGSLIATLQHMVGAEWVWLERFNGRSPGGFEGVQALTTLDALRRQWRDVWSGYDALLATGTTDGLRQPLAYRTFRGDAYEQPIGDMLQHVVNHGTYHRGQISMFLRLLGAAPPSTDLVIFQRRSTLTT